MMLVYNNLDEIEGAKKLLRFIYQEKDFSQLSRSYSLFFESMKDILQEDEQTIQRMLNDKVFQQEE